MAQRLVLVNNKGASIEAPVYKKFVYGITLKGLQWKHRGFNHQSEPDNRAITKNQKLVLDYMGKHHKKQLLPSQIAEGIGKTPHFVCNAIDGLMGRGIVEKIPLPVKAVGRGRGGNYAYILTGSNFICK